MLRIFTPIKIQRLRPGLNPQIWVPRASMLTTRPPKPSIPTVSYLTSSTGDKEHLFAVKWILTLSPANSMQCRAQEK